MTFRELQLLIFCWKGSKSCSLSGHHITFRSWELICFPSLRVIQRAVTHLSVCCLNIRSYVSVWIVSHVQSSFKLLSSLSGFYFSSYFIPNFCNLVGLSAPWFLSLFVSKLVINLYILHSFRFGSPVWVCISFFCWSSFFLSFFTSTFPPHMSYLCHFSLALLCKLLKWQAEFITIIQHMLDFFKLSLNSLVPCAADTFNVRNKPIYSLHVQ